ncbi:ribosomal protein S5 domain 2-type protein [Crucibulum laeve]|uniref:Ribosomal RNA-processing protein 43 n=1 Tax=Crucibulum laeve TaxID=68775 RepID=A0A5C3MEZ5_9AGAR|nr:ribosomal protein S5 domain 2-type protein [Crucibulum laeve]
MVPGLSTSSLHFTPLAHLNDSNPTLSFRFTVPNLDLPAICSPKFKPGPPTEEAQVLSDRLNEVLIASNILPLSSLSIQHGKAAWVLYVDATCINYDGNAFDAALIAMVAALRNTKLPRATYNPDSGRTICSRKELDPLQLNLQNSPVGISFGIFASTHILADPTSFEEPLLDTTLSIILGPQEQIISVSQIGIGSAGGQDALMKCLEEAKKRRRALKEVIGEV